MICCSLIITTAITFQVRKMAKRRNDLLKMNNDWNKKWINKLIQEVDNVLYPTVQFLVIFLATLPVSAASAERSFRELSRIKTYYLSTMK